MPVSFATGSVQKSGSQTYPVTQSITVGFEPKAIILFSPGVGTTEAAAFRDTERTGFGWATNDGGSMQNYSLSWGSDDESTAGIVTNTFRRARNDYCYNNGSTGATAYPLMRCTGFTSTAANFEFDQLNDTNTYQIMWAAIGGTDILRAKAGEFTSITTTGNQTVNVGFQPSIVFFLTGNSPNITTTVPAPHSTPGMSMTFGVGRASNRRATVCTSAVDNVNPSGSARYQRTDKCLAFFTDNTTGLDAEADFVGMTSTGFTINWTLAPTVPRPIYYLAIQGGTWNAGTVLSRTAAQGPGSVAETGINPTPKGLIMFGHGGVDDGTVQTHAKFSFGAAASTTQSVQMASGNLDNTTFPSSYRQYNVGTTVNNVYVYKDHSAGTQNQNNPATADGEAPYLTAAARLLSFDSGTGFTLQWDDVGNDQERVIYATVSDNPTANLINHRPATVGITEAVNYVVGKQRHIAETVGLTEAFNRIPAAGAQAHIRFVSDTVGISTGAGARGFTSTGFLTSGFLIDTGAATPEVITVLTPKGRQTINETVQLGEILIALLKRIRHINETVGLTDNTFRVVPTSTLQASAIQLRFSGGTANSSNTASLGGAISNNSVTDSALNNTWDDVTTAQTAAGLTEYRCFYVYNSHATLTAYNCEMWVDSTTPAGDTIEIAKGSAAMGGTEQTVASETTAPTAVSFSFAPDEASAILLGDIPPTTGRSIWIRRVVPAGTPSWNDNQYRLRMSFFSNSTA